MDVFNFMRFLINLFDGGVLVVGGVLALIGVVGIGLGLLDIYNHFKPENRDNPGEKNRMVSGAVKFAIGGLLASGGYQVLATNTFQDGASQNTIDSTYYEVQGHGEEQTIASIALLHGLKVS